MYYLSKFVHTTETPEYIALYNFVNAKVLIIEEQMEKEQFHMFCESGDLDYDSKIFQRLSSCDFIVSEEYDENKMLDFLYKRGFYNSDTLTVLLVPTQACNFCCKYCYVPQEAGVISDDILMGTIVFIKNMVQEKKYKRVEISWFGGEPLLFFDGIIKFMKQLKQELLGIEIISSMTTNGYCLNSEIFAQLIEVGVNSYQITLDGFPRTHDCLRILHDGGPTWEQVYKNLRLMANTDYSFKAIIRINFNEDVVEDIFRFMEYIKQEFDNRFIIHVHPISNMQVEGGNPYTCEPRFADAAKVYIYGYAADYEIPTDIPDMNMKIWGQVCYGANPNHYCIDEKGGIRKCTVSYKDDNLVGQIINESTYTLNLYALSRWTEINYRENSRCLDCKFLPICYGVGCPYRHVSNPEAAKSECTFNKDAVEIFLEKSMDKIFKKRKVLQEEKYV